jgi:CheY-like chemotaxis protein
MMGGRLEIESECGIGSTFTFTVPVGITDAPPERFARFSNLAKPSVLIVDSNWTTASHIATVLRRWNLEPLIATNGGDALERLGELGESIGLIVCDATLPPVNGLELLTSLQIFAGVPILATYPSGRRRPRGFALAAAGSITELPKPILESELYTAVRAVLHARETDREPGCDAPRSPYGWKDWRPQDGKGRILLVEDNAVNQKVVLSILKREGYSVLAANNGQEALRVLDRERFDLILMDVQMPVMDGFEATEEIRKRERGGVPRTPIIALTAHAMAGDEARCLAAGMDAYASKPIQKLLLLETIAKLVGREAPVPV